MKPEWVTIQLERCLYFILFFNFVANEVQNNHFQLYPDKGVPWILSVP